MESTNSSSKRPSFGWKTRLALAVVGAVLGALKGGPAGALGGAVLGTLAEICTWGLIDCHTRLWPWVRAFMLAGGGGCCVLGGAQEGLEGAILGGIIGSIIGLIVGLTFGT